MHGTTGAVARISARIPKPVSSHHDAVDCAPASPLVRLPHGSPREPPELLLAADRERRVARAVITEGSNAVRAAAGHLPGVGVPLAVPDGATEAIIVKLVIRCETERGQCLAMITPARLAARER